MILLSILATDTPFVARGGRLAITDLGQGFSRVVARYGFMETPNVPEILTIATEQGLELDTYSTSFYLGRETLLMGGEGKMAAWRKAVEPMTAKWIESADKAGFNGKQVLDELKAELKARNAAY